MPPQENRRHNYLSATLQKFILPYFFADHLIFNVWFYRALVFLVIGCPGALVVFIPLSYFVAIGLASKNGILLKGANFLDVIIKVNVVVMDKTGKLNI